MRRALLGHDVHKGNTKITTHFAQLVVIVVTAFKHTQSTVIASNNFSLSLK